MALPLPPTPNPSLVIFFVFVYVFCCFCNGFLLHVVPHLAIRVSKYEKLKGGSGAHLSRKCGLFWSFWFFRFLHWFSAILCPVLSDSWKHMPKTCLGWVTGPTPAKIYHEVSLGTRGGASRPLLYSGGCRGNVCDGASIQR